MKKLLDSKFLFITALSLVMLIILGILAFYLYKEDDAQFLQSGYVLNPLSAKHEKYYFDKGTGYRENLQKMLEFKDVDQNNVTVLKDSFVHYESRAIAFLNNGAILDLNSINGENAVKLYNITRESVIEKDQDGYVINNQNEPIKLDNFIGRISDSKYIVVGDIEAKIPGNEARIKADYFEIVFTEEGIVNIENNDSKYQVTADGTVLYIGNMTIDLGAKKITKDGKDVMSLTAITINGNENIEIIPKATPTPSPTVSPTETLTPTPTPTGAPDDGNDNGGGEGGGEGGNTEPTPSTVPTPNPLDLEVSLADAEIGSTHIAVTFSIKNEKEDDDFTLKVVDLGTGRTMDIISDVEDDQELRVNLLSPNTKYLFTLLNENDGFKYFQKIFETTDFGIKLEKKYATSDSLSYKVTVEEGSELTNAKLSLYKYNEETKQNEIVKVSYYDALAGEEKEVEKSVMLNSLDGGITGAHEVVFDMLDSNTIYTAVLDEFSVLSTNFRDVYNINITSMTLKEVPTFSDLTVSKDIGEGAFKLALSDITDKDSAITKYTYLIYDKNDLTMTAIDPIVRTSASSVEVKIGDGDNQLKNDTNYFYNVVIEYFDNEKYVEYITSDSINFVMGADPFITVIPDNDRISYDRIAATIYLIDNSCLVTMPGREKCNGASSVMVDVNKINPLTGDKTVVFSENVDFMVSENEVKYELLVDGLQPGITYTVDVRARRNDLQTIDRVQILHTDESVRSITTKTLSHFVTEWKNLDSNQTHVVHASTKLVGIEDTGTLGTEQTAASIQKIILRLYAGNYIEDIQQASPIATKEYVNTDEFNIKEKFFDNEYEFSSDEDFGMDIDSLRANDPDGNNRLSEFYTIVMYGYYDTGYESPVKIANNITVYRISPTLLMENVETPQIVVDNITNKMSPIDSPLANDGTVIGYKVTAAFDRGGLLSNHLEPKKITFTVYNADGNKVSFYIYDNNQMRLVNKVEASIEGINYYEQKIYMANGTDYYEVDNNMTRGNRYYVGYELELETEDSGTIRYPECNIPKVRNSYGLFASVTSEKETPTYTRYIAKSTATSLTYRYRIVDPDMALYKEEDSSNYGLYYVINDGEEVKVAIPAVDGDVRTYAGDVTINGLQNNDIYNLYFKKNGYKTGDLLEDVMNYYSSEDEGKRLFDGYYDALDNKYNFTFEVINNPLTDNKVTVKVNSDEDLLRRMLSYKVKFTDARGNVLDKEVWNLTRCNPDDSVSRCFSVDYIELKNAGMKSEQNQENLISVAIQGVYDNGLVGFDFTVGDGNQYQYMVLQDNNSATDFGKYLSYSSRGQLTQWTDAINMPRGYYLYSINNDRINYRSAINSYSSNIGYVLGSEGHATTFGNVSPKMVSVNAMSSDNNSFSFSSITPKVGINKVTSIINGAVNEMVLSGADIADFCEENSGTNCVNTANGDKYLYIEIWNDESLVGNHNQLARDVVKVKIDNSNPSTIVSGVMDKVNNGTKYYYQVYAYLNKNGVKTYTQLFDVRVTDRYETRTYVFQSLSSTDIFKGFELDYAEDAEGEYNDKVLNTKITLSEYAGGIPFNFDLEYAFCQNDDETCGIGEEESAIFKRVIDSEELETSIIDTNSITDYDLEFNKNYTIYLYAKFDVYDTETNTVNKKTLLLNRRNTLVNLRRLTVPEFVISREAGYDGNEYYIDFIVNVKDPSKVLNNGNYTINLIDADGTSVGSLQLKDENMEFVPVQVENYNEYLLSADEINRSIRITGLNANERYTVTVSGEAYVNNSEIPVEEKTMTIEKSHTVYSTNSSGVAFGKDVLYSATERSIVVTFLGGSNFGNVREVRYTIGLWDDEAGNATFDGTYDLLNGTKKFEIGNNNTDEWRFIIDPDGMINSLGQTYTVALGFKVYNEVTDQIDYYDSNDEPAFAGRAQYVIDN